jgi:hypothetical protein
MKTFAEPFPDPEIPSTNAHGQMIPPWIKYPNIPRQSVGWRMGLGEQYLAEFESWWNKQLRSTHLELRSAYPEPDEWTGFFRGL